MGNLVDDRGKGIDPERVTVEQPGPGGEFAFFDVLAGPNQPIHFPVPWATNPSFSFLLSPEETRDLIAQAGFCETSWLVDAQWAGRAADGDERRAEQSRRSNPARSRRLRAALT